MSWHEITPASRAVSRIHVVSKTHLDIGYTDQPDAVIASYLERFIPAAIDLNNRLADSERPERFVWTTGSWLIWQALELARGDSLARLERAIENGTLAWHGLPFTFHSELMTAELVRAGLRVSARLDDRFGTRTVAAKLTDVPGHTRSMVPLLAEAGIEFLHIGGNGGVAPPEVPHLFRWVDEGSSTSIAVMYHDDYGGFSSPAGAASAIDISVTQDNDGPPTLLQHVARMRAISDRYPSAEVTASTLDAFWRDISEIAPNLPALTSEIGDSWIYGAGSDPQKLRDFRKLSRLHTEWSRDRPLDLEVERFGQDLAMVAEHTWGLDTIVYLPQIGYANDDLDRARAAGRLSNFERSWARQRQYLTSAIDALSPTRRAIALESLESPASPEPDTQVSSDAPAASLEIDTATGELISCVDENGDDLLEGTRVGQISYQLYGRQAFSSYLDHYVKPAYHNEWWVGRAFGKHELDLDGGIRQTTPTVLGISQSNETSGPTAHVDLAFPQAEGGAPSQLTVSYHFVLAERRLKVTVSWPTKRATLLPEALWIRFGNPFPDSSLTVRKLGLDVDVHDVIRSAAGILHATDGLVRILPRGGEKSIRLRTLDAALVSIGDGRLLGDGGASAAAGSDINVNLFNNLWGTNFPLWVEDAAQFRFEWSVSSTTSGNTPQ